MFKVLRLTRHAAGDKQVVVLERLFPGCEIVQVSETLPSDARQAVARFDEIAADVDVVEAVLPIGLLSAVLKFSAFSKRGGQLIRAITRRELDGERVSFVFERYEELLKVEIVTRVLSVM